jgi:hypothetical protein
MVSVDMPDIVKRIQDKFGGKRWIIKIRE